MSPHPSPVVLAFLDHLAMCSCTPTTRYARMRILLRAETWNRAPMLAIDETAWAAWYKHVAMTVGDSTRGMYLSVVRSFYSWAVREGLALVDPSRRLARPRLPRRLPRPIDEDALALAISTSPPRLRPMFVLAALEGLRAMEIAGLRGEDVFVDHLIVCGKGGAMRMVPLHPVTKSEIALLPRRGWMFARGDSKPGPMKPHSVSQLCNKHLHELGISDTLHALRHRFATSAFATCRDIRQVQELLGHQSPTTTAIYTGWSRVEAAATVAAIPAGWAA